MKDLFSELFEYQWRDVVFPCASFDMDIAQDHAEHKWPDKDGAHIEGTGRNPIIYTARAIFRNGTKAGPNETFNPKKSYPSRYRAFILACADRSSGTLIHPEFGGIKAKCRSAKTHWDANKRDGVDVDVVWVEDTEDDGKLLTQESPVASAAAAAADLDAALTDYSDLNPGAFTVKQPDGSVIVRSPPGLPPMTFGQMMNNITAVFDQSTLLQKQLAGKIDEVAYRLDVLTTAVVKSRDTQAWPIIQATEHLKYALYEAKNKLLIADNQGISVYVVPQDATLAAISATLKAPIPDLIKLNTGLHFSPVPVGVSSIVHYPNTVSVYTAASSPVIVRGTSIRYYTNGLTPQ